MTAISLNRKSILMLWWVTKLLTWLVLLFVQDLIRLKLQYVRSRVGWLQQPAVRQLGLVVTGIILLSLCPPSVRRPLLSFVRTMRLG
jgi:hypothetical protein